MTKKEAKETLDKIIAQITGYQNPYSLDEFQQKFAFDVKLPVSVIDSTTGEETWALSPNPTKFITIENARKRTEIDDWMLPKREFKDVEDVLAAWNEINYTMTQRQIDSTNMAESDNVYNSQNIYRSQDVHRSKNILFSDSALDSEYAAAVQRSNHVTYSARVEDSKFVTNSFSISWSGKITNSLFIHDCYDVYESIFCSHIAGKKYCVANVQLEESEYNIIKKKIIHWMLTQ